LEEGGRGRNRIFLISSPCLRCTTQASASAEASGKFQAVSERVKIEASINSVRISVNIKQSDEIEEMLVRKFVSFLQQRYNFPCLFVKV
jgi:actin related protein 2/3 complex subunit 4